MKKNRKKITIYSSFDFPIRWKSLYPQVQFIHSPLDTPASFLHKKRPGKSGHQSLAGIKNYLTLLSHPIRKRELSMLPNLEVLATYSVGTNHIDLDTCRQRHIRVFNTPEVLTRATAELSVGLIFAVARRFSESERYLRTGSFKRNGGWQPELFLGESLQGKTATLVGAGRIGKETGRLLRAIGLKVVFINKEAKENEIRNLLKRTDILSFHCPLTASTLHWLNSKRLSYLPRQAIVINTARGEIIDESALANALISKKISGAGLDVFEREPSIHPKLLQCKNTILLPHLGSATHETREKMFTLAVDSILSASRNPLGSSKNARRPLPNEVR